MIKFNITAVFIGADKYCNNKNGGYLTVIAFEYKVFQLFLFFHGFVSVADFFFFFWDLSFVQRFM